MVYKIKYMLKYFHDQRLKFLIIFSLPDAYSDLSPAFLMLLPQSLVALPKACLVEIDAKSQYNF